MTASTKKTYASKWKEAFKEKFNRHDFWKDPDDWKKLLAQFKTAAQCDEQQGGHGGQRKILPIYKDISGLPGGSYSIALKELGVSVVDLKRILRSLMVAAHKPSEKGLYQKRVELILCKNSDGRGGKHYLLRSCTAMWDFRFNMPVFEWQIPKQLDEQTMVFAPEIPSPTAYITDYLHAFGCYFIVEGGSRNGQYPGPTRPFVFPNLHNKNCDAVARALTEVTWKGVKMAVPEIQKDHLSLYSSRSYRYGTSTELAIADGVTPDQRIFMSGHTHHKNADGYVNDSPALVVPAALAISGRKNVSLGNTVHPASFAWLGESVNSSLSRFLDNICPLDIPELMGNGKMRPFWLSAIAHIVMYHQSWLTTLVIMIQCANEWLALQKLPTFTIPDFLQVLHLPRCCCTGQRFYGHDMVN